MRHHSAHSLSCSWKGKIRLHSSWTRGLTLLHGQRGGGGGDLHPPPSIPLTCVILPTPGSPSVPGLPLGKSWAVLVTCHRGRFQTMAKDENGKGWEELGRLPGRCVVLHFTLTHAWLFWERSVLRKFNSTFSPHRPAVRLVWVFFFNLLNFTQTSFFNLLNFTQKFFPC